MAFPPESLPSHELGFALTVHKSQGSEYGQALLMLPPAGGRRLLSKELLYTAVTCAKHLAVLCATAPAFAEALARRVVAVSPAWGATAADPCVVGPRTVVSPRCGCRFVSPILFTGPFFLFPRTPYSFHGPRSRRSEMK